MRSAQIIDPPEQPDSLQFVGGKTWYQIDLRLEAVGLDTDNVIKPIDELSYTPDGGWANIDIGYFEDVAGWERDPEIPANFQNALTLGYINPRELAKQTVYRWYRIKLQDLAEQLELPLIPGWGGDPGRRIEELWQILPILDTQVLGWYDPSQRFHPYPAWVFGEFYDDSEDMDNSPPGAFCYLDFSIDHDRGIVQFNDYLYRQEPDGSISEAQLVLRTSVNVRDRTTGAWDRYRLGQATPNEATGAPARVIKREDVIRYVVPSYDDDHRVVQLRTSQEFNDLEAQYYLDAALYEYHRVNAEDVTYMGLLPISPDGAITQVTLVLWGWALAVRDLLRPWGIWRWFACEWWTAVRIMIQRM